MEAATLGVPLAGLGAAAVPVVTQEFNSEAQIPVCCHETQRSPLRSMDRRVKLERLLSWL